MDRARIVGPYLYRMKGNYCFFFFGGGEAFGGNEWSRVRDRCGGWKSRDRRKVDYGGETREGVSEKVGSELDWHGGQQTPNIDTKKK